MRVLLVVNLLVLIIGLGYAFRITDFLDFNPQDQHFAPDEPYFNQERQNFNQNTNQISNQERQGTELERQDNSPLLILPIVAVGFFASLIGFLGMIFKSIFHSPDDEFHWGYIPGKNGPDVWGDYYEDCNGMNQSPIDIMTTGVSPITETTPISMAKYDEVRIQLIGNLQEHFTTPKEEESSSDDDVLKNNGHTVQLDVVSPGEGVGALSGGPLDGRSYTILQLHFHWGKIDSRGSEHTLNGQEYPLELHIVHTLDGEDDPLNTENGLSVTGFFFEIDDDPNPALEPIIEAIKEISEADSKLPFSNSGFRLDELIKDAAPVAGGTTTYEYTTYPGSLTTPTCNEVVHWINFLTPLKISSFQLAHFRTLMDDYKKPIFDNFRPPQPLNNRPVTYYQAS